MQFIRKYKHGLIITIYSIVYTILFSYLEQRTVLSYHIIHTTLDDYIPFCEYFIVPYLLWFPYMVGAVAYFIFLNPDKEEYYSLTKNLCMGMTIFLIVSFIYPNGQMLRPAEFAHDNVFVDLVRFIYRADTPTNILPSIHVFNSLAVHLAILSCKSLKKRHGIRTASWILTVLIILSTMFLKQHSVVDVCLGTTLALAGYLIFYREKVKAHAKQKSKALNWSRSH